MKGKLTTYVVIAVISACWFDAMDRRYGVRPDALGAGFASSLIMGALWPLMLPIGLFATATGWGGRWTMPPSIRSQGAGSAEQASRRS